MCVCMQYDVWCACMCVWGHVMCVCVCSMMCGAPVSMMCVCA